MNHTDSGFLLGPPNIRYGIGTKLFLLVFLSIGLLILIATSLVSREANGIASKEIERSLARSEQILSTALKVRFDDIQRTAEDLAVDGTIFPSVEAKNSLSLLDRSEELKDSLGYDIIMFIDRQGNLLARSDRPDAAGKQIASKSHLISSALSGISTRGFMRKKSEILQIVAVPVHLPSEPSVILGSLALAYKLSEKLAQEINDLTASEVAFVSLVRNSEKIRDPRLQFSTMAEAPLMSFLKDSNTPWRNLAQQDQLITKSVNQIAGEEYHSVFWPLRRSDGHLEGFIVALRARSDLLAPFENISSNLWLLGAGGLLIALLLALLISKNISKPILSLADYAGYIYQGLDVETAEVNRRDEVGYLWRAMLKMGKGLREKNALESYLANFSSDMENLEELQITQDSAAATGEATSVFKSRELSAGSGSTQTIDSMKTAHFLMSESSQSSSQTIEPDKTYNFSTSAGETEQPSGQLSAGEILSDRYKINRMLGEGGYGIVYLAEDLVLQEKVALKLFPPDHLTNQELDRLKDEIRLARRISHRNVVRTYDVGFHEPWNFISMEYVSGYTLFEMINKTGPLPTKLGIVMARQMCSAIGAAHAEGIIHCDLKPHNMLVSRQGVLKIMDFGLSVAIQKPKNLFSPEEEIELEKPDAPIMGTPYYMAPEQFKAEALDVRTDIYALGVILFQIFSGELPFNNPDIFAQAKLHKNEIPRRLSTVLESIPEQLDEMIARCLEKKPSERFMNISELAYKLSEMS